MACSKKLPLFFQLNGSLRYSTWTRWVHYTILHKTIPRSCPLANGTGLSLFGFCLMNIALIETFKLSLRNCQKLLSLWVFCSRCWLCLCWRLSAIKHSFKFKYEILRKILVVHLLFLFCNRESANVFLDWLLQVVASRKLEADLQNCFGCR